ncbi:MAG: transposase [Thermostichus sp. DG02_5_bins_236]
MLNLTYEYRIYLSEAQAQRMTEWLETCCKVYNYALAERRDWIKSRKCDINACSLQSESIIPHQSPLTISKKKKLPSLQAVHSQILQDVMGRLEKVFNALWNSGHGFPRFKKHFLSFPQLGKNPVGKSKIKLPASGKVKAILHRQTVLRRSMRKWCAALLLGMYSLFCKRMLRFPKSSPAGMPLELMSDSIVLLPPQTAS